MVNATYQLDLSGKIHFAFTVTFQRFGPIPSGFRRLVIHQASFVLRPHVLCSTMGAKYLSGKLGEPSEGGFINLDTGVDRLFGNETDGENLRHIRRALPAPLFGARTLGR